jgi:hypothetical protein
LELREDVSPLREDARGERRCRSWEKMRELREDVRAERRADEEGIMER